MTTKTIEGILSGTDRQRPGILSPGRPALDHGALSDRVNAVAVGLNGLEIGPGDTVAMVLPNGPEMAVSFLGVASCAVAAPLNPAYTADELEFYLDDLNARCLMIMDGIPSPAIEVARRRGIPVITLATDPGRPAGDFDLTTEEGKPLATSVPLPRVNGPDDVSLVLHTSGTTSRPKIVPLTQRNICASAHNVAMTLGLTPADRCLNIMPLFHIHGLVAALLASIAAGGSVVCTPGFNALKVFSWIDDTKPTWYTAVPTMHQVILERAVRNSDIVARVPFRFIRSSSAALPAPVFERLEAVFSCPAIEAYGMTEAAHQMTSNRLPPGVRRAGTVGLAAGPDVTIMDESGALQPHGTVGEIVIRGENVTPGYRDNPKGNAEAFTNGWFRTGDQGFLDKGGLLTINGRLKEIINRGGEKISPKEVDDVLLRHPTVAQAVTFARPHAKLGEDVAAAVVLKEGGAVSDGELREFASAALAPFKVPREIVFVDEIPKGSTGKLQRVGLAEKLGLA